MSGGHAHPRAISGSGRHKRPLLIALALTASFLVVEVAVGVAIGSLALLSDAGHMLTDVAGLGMALAAIQVAQSHRSPSATFGLYRLEVLAALANALLLFGVAGYVLYEGWRRIDAPPEVPGAWLLVVAVAIITAAARITPREPSRSARTSSEAPRTFRLSAAPRLRSR
jgi:cobalt-zinc-cadmium efflux system protein